MGEAGTSWGRGSAAAKALWRTLTTWMAVVILAMPKALPANMGRL